MIRPGPVCWRDADGPLSAGGAPGDLLIPGIHGGLEVELVLIIGLQWYKIVKIYEEAKKHD